MASGHYGQSPAFTLVKGLCGVNSELHGLHPTTARAVRLVFPTHLVLLPGVSLRLSSTASQSPQTPSFEQQEGGRPHCQTLPQKT